MAGRKLANRPRCLRRPRMACSGRSCALELVVLPVADGAEQHRVGGLGELQRRVGQRMAVRLVGGAADQRLFELDTSARARAARAPLARRFRGRCRHRAGLRSSWCRCGANGVRSAGRLASQGWRARRSASKARILSAWRSVRPMSSKPLTRQYLRNGCTSNGNLAAVGLDDHLARQVDRQLVADEARHLVEQARHLRRPAARSAARRS